MSTFAKWTTSTRWADMFEQRNLTGPSLGHQTWKYMSLQIYTYSNPNNGISNFYRNSLWLSIRVGSAANHALHTRINTIISSIIYSVEPIVIYHHSKTPYVLFDPLYVQAALPLLKSCISFCQHTTKRVYVVSVIFLFPFSAINLFDWTMWRHLIQRTALEIIHLSFPFPIKIALIHRMHVQIEIQKKYQTPTSISYHNGTKI